MIDVQLMYNTLRAAGMTHEGACVRMGGSKSECAMIANNVEDRSGINDAVYTAQVDNGIISRERFATDGFGYGAAQWTFPPRKRKLYDFCKSQGTSIGDEAAQIKFMIKELKEDFPGLWSMFCTSHDIDYMGHQDCDIYENPEIPNYDDRISNARAYASYLTLTDARYGKSIEVPEPELLWPPRMICEGMSGEDVVVLQAILVARGYTNVKVSGGFDNTTKIYVLAFQGENGLATDGIVGPLTWAKLLER